MDTAWSSEFVQRSGVLSQGLASFGEAVCLSAQGRSLLLLPLSPPQGPPLRPGARVCFQVSAPPGFLRVSGILLGSRELRVDGAPLDVLELEAEPERVERVNRRAHYRVGVLLKGEVVFLAPGGPPDATGVEGGGRASSHLEALARSVAGGRRPCLVRDLGLGGALIATEEPVPTSGSGFVLDLAVGPGEKLRNLTGRVVEGRAAPDPSGFSVRIRLRFDRLSGATDARLSRYITQVQMESIKKGVRG